MRSRKIEIVVPHTLLDVFEERCVSQKMRSIGRWFLYLGISEIMREKRDELYSAIANADPDEQDEMIEFLLKLSKHRDEIMHTTLQHARHHNSRRK